MTSPPATVRTHTCASCQSESATVDYCDGCGAALGSRRPAPTHPAPEIHTTSCPSCTAVRAPGDAFCEVCGVDFESGELPAEPPEATDWTVVIEADRAFFDSNAVEAAVGLTFQDRPPREVALRGDEIVVGRRSETRGSLPDLDLSGDPGVSRRHAILRRQPDGSWDLIDDGSANGTWVNDATEPVTPGGVISLHDGDCIRLGAFHVLRIRGGRR